MKNYKIVWFLSFCLGAAGAQGHSDLQIGTRPQGMGGAFAALANDINAVYWNPAGLSQLSWGEATFMHWRFAEISQIKVNDFTVGYPILRGTFGFSWTRQGAILEEGPEADESGMSENHFRFAYGMNLNSRFAIGACLNRLVIESEVGSGAGFGFDVGGLFHILPSRQWSLAIVAKNLAGNIKNEDIKPFFAFGTAVKLGSWEKMHQMAFALDMNIKEDIDGVEGHSLKYATGLEYRLNLSGFSAALRGGYGSKTSSAGLGFSLNTVAIDYAYVWMREKTIGNSQRFGISFNLGRPKPSAHPKRTEAGERTSEKTMENLQLSVVNRDDKIDLTWNRIQNVEGYKILARIQGRTDWTAIHSGLVTETEKIIPNTKNYTGIQFIVVAVKNSRAVTKSNIITLK